MTITVLLGSATAKAERIWEKLYSHDRAEKRLRHSRQGWLAEKDAGFLLLAQAFLKRCIDLFGAAFLLAVLSPAFLLIAAAIKLSSKGPVIYRQVRLGCRGSRFMMYKFRTMEQDAEKKLAQLYTRNEMDAVLFKMKTDPRVTLVGHFLRRTSLDELPQLWNVLKGEMSLVGPRPPLEREVRLYRGMVRRRLDAIPGMTGIWQVSGRSTLPVRRGFALDVLYVKKWNILLDLAILLRTIPAVLGGKGAF